MSKAKSITNLAYNNAKFLKFNEGLARKYGYDIAILIGIFMELENYFESDRNLSKFFKATNGYFYCMAKYVHKRNGMSPDKMRRAVKKLEDEDIIYTKKWAKNWKLYSINHTKLSSILLIISLENLEDKSTDDELFKDRLDEIQSISDML